MYKCKLKLGADKDLLWMHLAPKMAPSEAPPPHR